MATDTIISLKNIRMQAEHRSILEDINFDVKCGDFVAITGPNGGGKTTLLRILLKLIKPTAGEVRYFHNGQSVKRLPIGYLPQKNMIDSRFPISVKEVIASGLIGCNRCNSDQATEMTKKTISLVGLDNQAHQCIGSLSGGQLQRALLGRAIISNPDVLVLDEPLSYVDKQFEHHIYELVGELSKQCTILLVSHEMTTIASMANRHLIIDRTLHECHSAHHFVHSECDE